MQIENKRIDKDIELLTELIENDVNKQV